MRVPRTFIIAEAGVNHNGELRRAHDLIEAACRAGADAVKFQTFRAHLLASAAAPLAGYQAGRVAAASQLEMLSRLELRPAWHHELAAHCREAGIEFMSTPFDPGSADFLAPLVRRFKVSSADLTDLILLRRIARHGKPVILSTGMATLSEIESGLAPLRACDVTLLHCTSSYPAPAVSINLRAISTLGSAFGLPVGYSDHTEGCWASVAAVALGASVIEKHLTLDKGLPGPDHRASLEPEEFAALVKGIRSTERALGDGVKRTAAAEENTRLTCRKSLALATSAKGGTILRARHLVSRRPATGISPACIDNVIGRRIRVSLRGGAILQWRHLA